MKIKSKVGFAVAFTILMTISFLPTEAYASPVESVTEEGKQSNKEHVHWSISDLSDSLAKLEKSELVFMDENSMQGIYVEVKKGQLFQRKATKDDLYYLHSGTCSVKIGKQKRKFSKGGILYVKEDSELTIVEAKEPLQIVIVTIKLSSNSAKPKWKHFSKSTTESRRQAAENAWNPFLMHSNVILGRYLLPHEIDGDARLVHKWQELNIVTSGSSKFVMDSGTIDVTGGSIFFVEEGNGHYFDSLKSDVDVLILWEQRNVDHSNHY